MLAFVSASTPAGGDERSGGGAARRGLGAVVLD